MFSGLRSDSVALSGVWLGLPGGRFQSGGSLQGAWTPTYHLAEGEGRLIQMYSGQWRRQD